ncbi:MAG: hypothetical protein IJ492_05000 [Clostridia bacterium]|nr:hypothetical protein [Clostridia bacterium]MBQ8505608.1 hypothetical protein [Clostridia bacterium]MBQ8771868.1 hypothetical protein [Clostridia bacterium]
MKKTPIRQVYWFIMICHIFTLLCGICFTILFFIHYEEFIDDSEKIFDMLFFIGIIVVFVIVIVCSAKVIVTLLKDAKSLKNNEYVSIVGKVLRFKKNIDPDTGTQMNNTPIVLILDTNVEVELHIRDEIMVGEIYKFNYLKNSKIAEVVDVYKQ